MENMENLINARILEIGEIVEPTDLYLSSSGHWEPVPISGHIVIDNGVSWARPNTRA